MPESDADLVASALRGSQDAFRVLAERHAGAVFNLVFRLVRHRGVAEELAQDALAKAFLALRSFDPSCRFSPWLLRIAHNTAIDYLRRRRPDLVPIPEDPSRPGTAPVLVDPRARSPLHQAELADLRSALDWALNRLRPEFRTLVVLRYQEDLSYEEIAASLNLPLGTVKSHLHRARHTMAVLLEEAGWAPSPPAGTAALQPGAGPET